MRQEGAVLRALFLDEVRISVAAGGGGHGCMSFRREKFIPKGGPSGGDGADGGHVILYADSQLNTLQHLAGQHHWKAQRGGHGMGSKCHGKNGEDCRIPVPPGTLVFDSEHEIMLSDLTEEGAEVCVAVGGHGGKGNCRFRSATNQAPREFEEGTPGQTRKIRLELKLMADVALVGKPNAGKSTILSRLSSARPKIADYPFTTLTPYLGIVELSGYRRIVMADIPGLIEGAHEGHGLGHDFLRHIERCRVILHVVDVCPLEGDPTHDYKAIHEELREYSSELADRPELVVANKMDLTDADAALELFEEGTGKKVLPVSAVAGINLEALKEALWDLLHPQED
jgi:GTP-binding protein